MLRYLTRRLTSLVATLFVASIVVFLLIQLVPGDAAISLAGFNATKAGIAAKRHQLGLDQPLVVQYWHWLTRALRGNLGNSFISNEPVTSAISRGLPVTLTIVICAMLMSIVLGVPAGIIAGWRSNRSADRIVTAISAVGIAIPTFWLALILVSFFSIQHRWLPATGYVSFAADPWQALQHAVLPAFAMGIVGAAEIARQLRAAMITSLNSDYVRTLYAKGLSTRGVLHHAFRNSAVPLLTIVGLQANRFLGATIIVEAVFGISGLGGLIVNATRQKDFVIIQGVVLVMALIVILTNIVVDISYRLVDPRIQ